MTVLFFRRIARLIVRNPPAPLRVAALLIAVLLYGTTGLVYFELPAKPEIAWNDSLWWSIVTITTVGYGDYFPTTSGGRFLVAAPLMLFGIGLLGYVVSLATSALVEARTKELKGMLSIKAENHVVICNYPGLAKLERVLDELRQDEEFGHAHEIVLVDEDLEELPAELVQRHVHFVRGNPTRDETLGKANIDKAYYAIVLAKKPGNPESDALNLMITLAIEARTRHVKTTVECVEASAQELLKKAGCDSVVCVGRFDAHFIGNEVLQPGMQNVVDDLLSTTTTQQLCLSPMPDGLSTFADVAELCRKHKHIPVGILRGHDSHVNAALDMKVAKDDRIISIGTQRIR